MTEAQIRALASAGTGASSFRLAVLINPSAGAGRGAGVGRSTVARLRHLGHQVEVVSASDARAAERAAAEVVARQGERRVDALVVVGGDGMVHLAVNVVAGTGVPLGVVPAGTGNDIARSWGLPLDLVAAVDTVDACCRMRAVRAFDVIAVDGGDTHRWVAGVVAAGFDAVVNERANAWRWPKGRARYNLAIARELPLFRAVPYTLLLDGQEWRTEGLLVAIANTSSYGGGMRIAPDAEPTDGLLDVVVVRPVPLSRFIRLFPKVYDGSHVDVDAVEVRRAARVEVSVDRDGRFPRQIVAYGDGERLGPLPRTLTARQGALSVLAPHAT